MQLGEECDDGNMSNTDACVGMCKLAKCGDGFLQMSDLEQCDDGNILPNDGCSATCQLEGAIIVKAVAQNKPISDGPYAGTQATMVCVDLVADGAGNVKSVTVKVGVTHDWIGDLTYKLFSPNNTKTLTLMSRPGLAEVADDGNGCCGDSSMFSKDFPLLFRDIGVKDAELAGNTISIDQVVCKDDAACDYKANPGKGPGVSFADFNGIAAAGTWKFCAGDSVAGDSGTIDSVTLTILTQ
jgi:cysteine-rich repeat protein